MIKKIGAVAVGLGALFVFLAYLLYMKPPPSPIPPHTFHRAFAYFSDPETGLCFVTVTEEESWSNDDEGMGGRTTRTTTNVPCRTQHE
jgi:hypothetical protein